MVSPTPTPFLVSFLRAHAAAKSTDTFSTSRERCISPTNLLLSCAGRLWFPLLPVAGKKAPAKTRERTKSPIRELCHEPATNGKKAPLGALAWTSPPPEDSKAWHVFVSSFACDASSSVRSDGRPLFSECKRAQQARSRSPPSSRNDRQKEDSLLLLSSAAPLLALAHVPPARSTPPPSSLGYVARRRSQQGLATKFAHTSAGTDADEGGSRGAKA